MKSRLLKTILSLVAPLVIDYLVKKITKKKEVKPQLPSPSDNIK